MIELIPAIDVIDGKCVRLSQGNYDSKKVYNESPLEVAKAFEAHGMRRLHVVDLDGAASQHVVNYRTLEQIATHTSLTIDFGGGIKTAKDIDIAFNSGAQMVTLGSVAVKNPELFDAWLNTYGNEKIILGSDVKENRIAISGWKEESPLELMPFLDQYIKKGITKVLCTDISRDGMLRGAAFPLYKEIMGTYPELYLIASGGISCLDDILQLDDAGIPAVVFGKAIYEGRISLNDLTRYIIS
ncbi:MAG TPA: 1-(5-phosphoribosyl)-5-[(5-phosphoribosylamino)methylideneamino]imidazole-4-carboxamide isomerase [Candidatus Phocaeicola gallistercoris]|nr:1-(5-phosphoribosyl)-5-[(5-phosphoribosylamino)methylideneamino]imidazole-4-carboxamide isomerase [Candidatus Phocaeicola gallistercoris]